MRERRGVVRAVVLLALPFLLVGCSGDDDGGVSDTAVSQLLFQLNAVENGGNTVRWPRLPIEVFLGDVGEPNEMLEWTRASEGAVTFAFVGGPPGAGISFGRARLLPDVCGVTNVVWESDRFVSADVRVNGAIYRGPGCVRTVTHEGGHAIGILNHTADGGLMDTEGGNGEITGGVAAMIRDLYSLSPGTPVSISESRSGSARRSGRRHTMTFVYWARR